MKQKRVVRMTIGLLLVTMMLTGPTVMAAQSNFDGYQGSTYSVGYLRASFEEFTSSFSAQTGDSTSDVYTLMDGTGTYTSFGVDETLKIFAYGWNSCFFQKLCNGSAKSANCHYYIDSGEVKYTSVYV